MNEVKLYTHMLHQLFEEISVYRDQLTTGEIWQLLDQLTDQQAIDLAQWIWHYQSGMPGQVINQIQGIIDYYRRNRVISDRQRRYLAITCLNYWQNLTLEGRRLIK